ncbi:MAG: hypothetical protein GWP14_02760 [Actinobacteria bacterium]|nr:hypothetical protein [Actinomycetota bacterium]
MARSKSNMTGVPADLRECLNLNLDLPWPLRHLESLLVVGLAAVLLISPVFFGSVAIWAQSLFFLIAVALLALWILRGVLVGRLPIARTGLWFLGLLCLALIIFQTIPISWPLLARLSPNTAVLYQRTLPALTESSRMTLSVSPQATRTELYRLAIMIIVFVVAINSIRTPRKLVFMVLVLLALGSYQSLYAFLTQFAGQQTRLAGTFHSKNQFAGLLAMLVPLSLALIVGLSGRKTSSVNFRSTYGLAYWLGTRTFAQQVLVAAVGILMGLAALFSLSRAGLFALFAGVIVFGCYLFNRAGLRRYALVVFLVISIAFASAALIGMNKIFEGVQDAASLQALSWRGRLDLAQSALRLIRDFSLTGTGLGTTPLAFSRYQSLVEGDWTVYSLHNDWLQMACENGLVVFGLVVAMLIVFFFTVCRRLSRSCDQLSKFISIAALIGAGTILLHSLWDRNLSKVTSNGIVFAVLLAMAYSGAHLSKAQRRAQTKPGYWYLPLGPRLVWVSLLVVIFAGLGVLCIYPARAGLADIRFNEYLRASPTYPSICQSYPGRRVLKRDDYFWLRYTGPIDDRDWSIQRLKLARQLDPGNPRYIREQALCLVEDLDRLVDQQAPQAAQNLLGAELARASRLQRDRIIWALAAGIRQQIYTQHKEYLLKARLLLTEAIDLAPTKPSYHSDLAFVLSRLEKLSDSPSLDTAGQQMDIALWLAPHKPNILFGSACLSLDQANATTDLQAKELLLSAAVRNFRRAMFGGPDPRFYYPRRIYQLLEMSGQDALLFQATPKTVTATRELALHFLQTRRWRSALEAWQILQDIVDSPAEPVSLASLLDPSAAADVAEDLDFQRTAGTPSAYSPRGKPVALSRKFTSQAVVGSAQAFAQLGLWDDFSGQTERYQQFLRRDAELVLDEAERLAAKRRYHSAMSCYLSVLRTDWANPRALLGAAEVIDMPGLPRNLRRWNSSLEQLYRLVMYSPSLSSQQYQRVSKIASGLRPDDETSRLELDFILAAAQYLSGHHEQAIESLVSLTKLDKNVRHAWGQEHLIWYFLGRSQQAVGKPQQAVRSYVRALKIVPTHLPSLKALHDLQDDKASQMLSLLTPANPCNIDFGGKVRLLGYTILPESEDADLPWRVRYFWQFQDRVLSDCRVEINFCNAQGRSVFSDVHQIRDDTGPYYMPAARWGQVVVEERPLKIDPTRCDEISFALRLETPPVGVDKYLPNRLSLQHTRVACIVPAQTIARQ